MKLGWWHSKLDEQSTLLRLQHRLINVQHTSCRGYGVGEAGCTNSPVFYVRSAMAFILARHMRHVHVGMSHNGQVVCWSRSFRTFAYLRNKSYLTQRATFHNKPLPLCIRALNSGTLVHHLDKIDLVIWIHAGIMSERPVYKQIWLIISVGICDRVFAVSPI